MTFLGKLLQDGVGCTGFSQCIAKIWNLKLITVALNLLLSVLGVEVQQILGKNAACPLFSQTKPRTSHHCLHVLCLAGQSQGHHTIARL